MGNSKHFEPVKSVVSRDRPGMCKVKSLAEKPNDETEAEHSITTDNDLHQATGNSRDRSN